MGSKFVTFVRRNRVDVVLLLSLDVLTLQDRHSNWTQEFASCGWISAKKFSAPNQSASANLKSDGWRRYIFRPWMMMMAVVVVVLLLLLLRKRFLDSGQPIILMSSFLISLMAVVFKIKLDKFVFFFGLLLLLLLLLSSAAVIKKNMLFFDYYLSKTRNCLLASDHRPKPRKTYSLHMRMCVADALALASFSCKVNSKSKF